MSPTEFELIFVTPEVSGPGDTRIAAVEELLDIVVESHSGLTLATVTAEGDDAVTAALDAAAVLSSRGLPVVRSYPDLVTRQDIADRAEVSRQAVGNWVRGDRMQSDPFPAPVNLVGGGAWLWGDVVAWLRRQDYKIDDIEFPSMDDHVRIDAALVGAPRRTPKISGHLEAKVGFAPAVVGISRDWAGDSFQSSYALAV
ncbi:hypothetical protein MLGJGCBP_02013 [Rhodococcus sp. T7]|uniref:DNA-binding protein n=2 Tax=Rhodococcus opacus TaxID=37919 RepID=C1BC35_RHOOB|nr:hypothetical protein W59_28385 [Rhodococcus opacus RKJ300 = JCM 13270]KAF0964835.1 hypothetical protein MLGJGCBP_02013 [Rhodococcus sp. T7]QQZ18616.1 hypothetical protein GO592_41525 [Rhodococcus sp. 21391]BAH55617.1 hypothetical protein ROP_pROB01-01180 [Rhodococcus opacus B4]